jgi:hypothetical protein
MTKDEILAYVPPAAKMLGREVVEIDQVNGGAVLRFRALPEFLNRHGTVQGGILCAGAVRGATARVDWPHCQSQRLVPQAGEGRDIHRDESARDARRA